MTPDFYAVLDTMFYRLPEHEAMDHEWLYYFVTGNGGTIADYEVLSIEQTDDTHAVATLLVRQVWPEGVNGAEDDEPEEHRLYMERQNGVWLMADFDEHKADCRRYIANNRKEQAIREAISTYLVNEIGTYYLQGELCVPTLMIVAEEEPDSIHSIVWGDFWIIWYRHNGDSLEMVSGGNHSGCIRLTREDGKYVVTSFDQTEDGAGNDPSARRIFGPHYELYQQMHSNDRVWEAVRKEQLEQYLRDKERIL